MMKNIKWINRILLLGMVVGLIAVVGITVKAGIRDSAHDFSGQGWSRGEICLPCHTPHHADISVTGAPLWNHTVTATEHTPYDSSTLDAAVRQPGGISRLCLSCHDGTVAIDSFSGVVGVTALYSTEANLGIENMSMSNDHPVSFRYDTALASTDRELFDPATTESGLGRTIQLDMLHDDFLECASCHDVHDSESVGNPTLLRINNAGSRLCLVCHAKE